MLQIAPRSIARGRIRPPGDKSLTHRALLFAALAEGSGSEEFVSGPGVVDLIRVPSAKESVIELGLDGEDCQSTRRCLQLLGHEIEEFRVRPGDWISPAEPLDCGNSGTTMRLLAGILAGRQGISATLIGDASLSKRPMKRVAAPLRQMGADIQGDTAPLRIQGQNLHAIDYESPVASAQVKSAILLAGLRAKGKTWVKEPHQSRDHTERMLSALGVKIERREDGAVGLEGGQTWSGFHFRVPGDISSAAYWLVLASLLPGSEVTLDEVGVNPTRTGILDVLSQVGVTVEASQEKENLGEPSANLTVRGPENLSPFRIEGALTPRLIDEIPVLAVLATQCHGQSVIRDAAELRVKESDRILEMARGLTDMGAAIEVFEDGFTINGPTKLRHATIDAGLDHRIAMSFAVAGCIAEGGVSILGEESIATSYPQFLEHMNEICPE